MAVPILYRAAARREIVEAARDYERLRPGFGSVFLDEIARVERHVSDAPGLYQEVEREIRRAVLRRFPYGLFYVEEAAGIVVLACLDLRRDPQAIEDIVGRR
jgi:toxin ParE1/3/4